MKRNNYGGVSGRTITVLVLGSLILAMGVGGSIYLLSRSGNESKPDLVVYAYESFMSYGLGSAVIPKFEKMYGVDVEVVTPGDMGAVLGKMSMEKTNPRADVVIGVDNSMLYKAVEMDLLEPYVPVNIDRLDPTMSFDPDHYVVPFDYGYLAIICNGEMMRERELKVPDDLMDLGNPQYRGQMLLLDPATSSTGSSFMIWAASVSGDNYTGFFHELADNAEGRVLGTWDSMYNQWEKGEAPMAISYGLDTAYEVMSYGTNNTITVVPDHQGYRQIEGTGLVKGAKHEDLAERFLDFVLTNDFQSEVHRNYMLPVVPGIEVDPIFVEYGESAVDNVEPTTGDVIENYDDWYGAWREAFLL